MMLELLWKKLEQRWDNVVLNRQTEHETIFEKCSFLDVGKRHLDIGKRLLIYLWLPSIRIKSGLALYWDIRLHLTHLRHAPSAVKRRTTCGQITLLLRDFQCFDECFYRFLSTVDWQTWSETHKCVLLGWCSQYHQLPPPSCQRSWWPCHSLGRQNILFKSSIDAMLIQYVHYKVYLSLLS